MISEVRLAALAAVDLVAGEVVVVSEAHGDIQDTKRGWRRRGMHSMSCRIRSINQALQVFARNSTRESTVVPSSERKAVGWLWSKYTSESEVESGSGLVLVSGM